MKKILIDVTFENGKVRSYYIDSDIDYFESSLMMNENPYLLNCIDDRGRKAVVYFDKIASYSYEEVEI